MDWQNAIFAPGWFWSMLSMVLIVGSLIGLYRQLRMQSAQGAREQLDAINLEWTSERFDRCKVEILRALRDNADRAIVPGGAAIAVAGYWERIGTLVKGGHVDPTLLHNFHGGACPVWWVALAPFIAGLRDLYGDPTEYGNFEWLAGTMAELDRRAGASAFDTEMLMGQLVDRIAVYEDRLRLEEALRSATG